MIYKLQHPYSCLVHKGELLYGGNQLLSDNSTIRSCGCGLVAACDLFLYLHRYNGSCFSPLFGKNSMESPVQLAVYNEWLTTLRRYFPLIPHFGINGLLLAGGINSYFRRYHIPMKAHWGLQAQKQWARMEEMLARDIPVIMSIGPNLPLFWQRNKTALYTQTPAGEFLPSLSVCAHYVTVTAMDEQWLTVSSWGKKHFIDRREYQNYVKKHSSEWVSNIIFIQKK